MVERLQKLMAQAGYGSRRSVEQLIYAGRITINGKIATLGAKVDVNDDIRLDNRHIKLAHFDPRQTRVFMMNKGIGVLCGKYDNKQRPSVFEYLPDGKQWIMVGRLDINSAGLILWTNNGELAKRLMHPSYQIERVYNARILGAVSKTHLQQLKTGVQLSDTVSHFKDVRFLQGSGANRWYQVTLTRGKNREVRRLWQALGFQVNRLIRVRFGNISLPPDLAINQTKIVNHQQMRRLMSSVALR